MIMELCATLLHLWNTDLKPKLFPTIYTFFFLAVFPVSFSGWPSVPSPPETDEKIKVENFKPPKLKWHCTN